MASNLAINKTLLNAAFELGGYSSKKGNGKYYPSGIHPKKKIRGIDTDLWCRQMLFRKHSLNSTPPRWRP